MKNTIKTLIVIAALLVVYSACKKQDYQMGDLNGPANLVINTELVGQSPENPYGDGSGDVNITISADNALAYKVGFDANSVSDYTVIPSTGKVTKKFTSIGTNTYRITAIVTGKGGTTSTVSKDVTVAFDYVFDQSIVTKLTGDASKSWVVDKSVPGHFGVGPWDPTSVTPAWWSAGINEKLSCCPCFYTATFTFTKVTPKTYKLQVTTDNAFTKTGSLTTLPGIPATGGEGCYPYPGGTSEFAFVPASSGIPEASTTTTAILLQGVETYIAYGATKKEYEILSITDNTLYLRVQGTETGNAWYIKMIPATK